MRLVTGQGLVAIKVVPMDTEAVTILTHQLIYSVLKGLLVCCWNNCITNGLDICVKPKPMVLKSPNSTINAKGCCETLRILYTVIKRTYPDMLITGVCVIMPISTLSRTCCILCTAWCLTISCRAQTFHCVTSICSAPLSKVL